MAGNKCNCFIVDLVKQSDYYTPMNAFHRIRSKLGLTQAVMAGHLGVTQSNVSHYEQGQTVPPDVAAKLIQVAKRCGHEITFDDVYADRMPPRSRRAREKAA